ncbi:MAG: hypothetical protein U5L04_05740 [Trueperaceae bacterium]|nr:hypothetical protein [Trueperaceae bacterium]
MRKIQQYVLKNQMIFIGLEDAKKTWKLCVQSGTGRIVAEAKMEARYEVLRSYLNNKFPKCPVKLIYEAGFSGFDLFDRLFEDGHECVVTPPHPVTEEKSNKRKRPTRLQALGEKYEKPTTANAMCPTSRRGDGRQISRNYGQTRSRHRTG